MNTTRLFVRLVLPSHNTSESVPIVTSTNSRKVILFCIIVFSITKRQSLQSFQTSGDASSEEVNYNYKKLQ
jgi:hypothetical protein